MFDRRKKGVGGDPRGNWEFAAERAGAHKSRMKIGIVDILTCKTGGLEVVVKEKETKLH